MLSHFVVINKDNEEIAIHFSYFSRSKIFGLVEENIGPRSATKVKLGTHLKFIGKGDVFYNQAFLLLYNLEVGKKYKVVATK